MDGVQQLDELMPILRAMVDGIDPRQLDHPTPCAKFTVTGVLEHMIGGVKFFAPQFRGEPSPAEADDADGDTIHQIWHRAMTELLAAMHSPGAQERTVESPFGPVPGALFFRYVVFDGLMHGWDLGVATAQRYAPRPELVAEVDAFARGLLKPEMRDGDTFGAEVQPPADATELERLVAFSGRPLSNAVAAR